MRASTMVVSTTHITFMCHAHSRTSVKVPYPQHRVFGQFARKSLNLAHHRLFICETFLFAIIKLQTILQLVQGQSNICLDDANNRHHTLVTNSFKIVVLRYLPFTCILQWVAPHQLQTKYVQRDASQRKTFRLVFDIISERSPNRMTLILADTESA